MVSPFAGIGRPNIGLGNVQGQAQALAAAQAAAAAAGTPADLASVIAASPGTYGVFIPTLLSRFGPAFTQNLVSIIGGAASATPTVPTAAGGWGGPGGENPAYRGQGKVSTSPMYGFSQAPVMGPDWVNPQRPGTNYDRFGNLIPWPAPTPTVAPGAATTSAAPAAARQARLRAILGMGSAAAGVTTRLRG